MNSYSQLIKTNNPIDRETVLLLSESFYKYEQKKESPIFLQNLIDEEKKASEFSKEFFKSIGWFNKKTISEQVLKEGIKFASEKQVNSKKLLTIDQISEINEQIDDGTSHRFEYKIAPSFIYDLLIRLVNIKDSKKFLNSFAMNSSVLSVLNKIQSRSENYFETPNEQVALNFYLINYLFDLDHNEVKIGEPLLKPSFVEGDQLIKFDTSISVPPFDRLYYEDYIENDEYQRFVGTKITSRDSTSAHILHVLSHLNENGRAAILVHGSPLFQTGRRGTVRELLLNNDYIEGVIALPSALMRNTSIPTFVLVINKSKQTENKNQVIFIDATSYFDTVNKKRVLIEEHIEEILELYTNLESEDKAKVVSVPEILENESILNPMRYLTNNDLVIEGIGSVKIDEAKYKKIKMEKLDSYCEVITGSNIKKSEVGEEVKIINGKALQDGSIKISEIEEVIISNKDSIKRSKVKQNDLLMLSRGATPKFAVAGSYFEQNEVYATSNLFILRPKENTNPEFLQSYLCSPFGLLELSKVQKGTTIPMYTAKAVKLLPIPQIDRSVQNKIKKQYVETSEQFNKRVKEAKQDLNHSRIGIYEQMGLMDAITNN